MEEFESRSNDVIHQNIELEQKNTCDVVHGNVEEIYPDDDERYLIESDDNLDSDDDELSDDDCQDSYEPSDDLRGLVGLQNLGNTCYMNGALQALSNCQQLTRFVLDCPGFLKEKGLCRYYSDLIKEIWDPKSPQYAVPTSIIRSVKCIYPAFRGCTQQDTQEFLRCFLEQLHDELKQPLVSVNPSSESGDKNDAIVNNTQRSIISDTFEFKISSSVVCSSCNNISTTKETFKDLSIPIPTKDHPYYQTNVDSLSVNQAQATPSSSDSTNPQCDANETNEDNENKECVQTSLSIQKSYFDIGLLTWFWKLVDDFNNWFWGPKVTLHDCLSIFFGSDSLEGENEYSCEVCTKKNRGVKYLKILELPEVLCIHFKRYESIGSAKITTHVSFPLTGLDLAPFMSPDSRAQCTTYNLIACICHHGSALLTGHYTTYALNCYDDQWYEFDDQYVTSVQSYQVEESEAYILFYQKSTLDDRTDRQRVKASKLLRKSLAQGNTRKYFISKQWVNKFNTFVEPGPITNFDFLCKHRRVPMSRQAIVSELCHPISESVWKYLRKLHGGGPPCRELSSCDICE